MKRNFTLTAIALFMFGGAFAQNYSTGTVVLNSNGGSNLNYSAKIDVNSNLVTMTLIGPSSGWLGIGFDAASMTDNGMDIVIFDGTNLTDRTLNGFSAPALDAQQDWTVVSNSEVAGVRTVVGTRARDTGDSNDYTFTAAAQPLTLIYARRITNFSILYHGGDSCGTTVANLVLGNADFSKTSFNIYPNPANSVTTVELPATIEKGELKIYDNLGKVVIKQQLSQEKTVINTSELSVGSYLVVVRTEYGNATKTLLIQ